MQYKLILIEGLPGTGKTTLSKQLFKWLTEKDIQTEMLLEENENCPSNFFNIAGIPKMDAVGFMSEITPVAKTDHYVFANLGHCKEDIANQLQRYNVGDEFNTDISLREYVHCTLEWWQNWVQHYIKDAVLIIDSAFMQNPMNEMIFRKATDAEVIAYMQALSAIIKPYKPICIYLRRENAKTAIDFAKAVKGEQWAKGIDGLADMGCADLFERRFILENTLLSLVHHVVCHINGYDWSDAVVKTRRLLGLEDRR